MNWSLRLPSSLVVRMRADLERPHDFAFERVGVLYAGVSAAEGRTLLLATGYEPVADGDYIPDAAVGARIGPAPIRRVMQAVLDRGCAAIHVHSHGGRGKPRFSRVDLRDLPGLVRSLRAVGPAQPHGALVLSRDSCEALIWLPGESEPAPGGQVSIVGFPTTLIPAGGLYA